MGNFIKITVEKKIDLCHLLKLSDPSKGIRKETRYIVPSKRIKHEYEERLGMGIPLEWNGNVLLSVFLLFFRKRNFVPVKNSYLFLTTCNKSYNSLTLS